MSLSVQMTAERIKCCVSRHFSLLFHWCGSSSSLRGNLIAGSTPPLVWNEAVFIFCYTQQRCKHGASGVSGRRQLQRLPHLLPPPLPIVGKGLPLGHIAVWVLAEGLLYSRKSTTTAPLAHTRGSRTLRASAFPSSQLFL